MTQYYCVIQLNNQIKHFFCMCSFSQFVVLLYLLTYVGVLTNGLTLVITGEFFFQTLVSVFYHLHDCGLVRFRQPKLLGKS